MPMVIVQTANVTVGRTLNAIYCDGNRRLPVPTVGMSDQAAQPIQLHLITQCPAAMPSSDLRGGGNEPTITIQLKTLGGQIYLVPLSVLAARGLLAALVLWPPAADVVPRQPLEPPV